MKRSKFVLNSKESYYRIEQKDFKFILIFRYLDKLCCVKRSHVILTEQTQAMDCSFKIVTGAKSMCGGEIVTKNICFWLIPKDSKQISCIWSRDASLAIVDPERNIDMNSLWGERNKKRQRVQNHELIQNRSWDDNQRATRFHWSILLISKMRSEKFLKVKIHWGEEQRRMSLCLIRSEPHLTFWHG